MGDVETSIDVEITIDQHISVPLQIELLKKSALIAAALRGFTCGEIGIRITDNPTIREINLRHLQHDYATDVISFGYSDSGSRIEGEMVISVDTARTEAIEIGWSMDHELCLYVAHGTLHLTGMDDQSPQRRIEMRQAEAEVMHAIGIRDFDKYEVDRPRKDR